MQFQQYPGIHPNIETEISNNSNRHHSCNKLYGRSKEIETLLAAFQSVCNGPGETIFLQGTSGVGKTEFARFLRMPTIASNGFFLEGKFDQYGTNVPFHAFRQVLSQFCQFVLADKFARREQWRTCILEGVGDCAQLLIDLEPNFESIIGAQPPIPKINPTEAKYRFSRVMRAFFEVICKPEHPVVLFLDDLQWADKASLDLLHMLHGESTLRFLLIIAAYRDDEIDSVHPFAELLADLRALSCHTSILKLENLGLIDFSQYVADSLEGPSESVEGIVEFVFERTKGNPFFTKTYLDFLLHSNLLRLESDGAWQLEEAVFELAHPTDVVSWFRIRFQDIDDECRDLLALASCVGYCFDTGTLSIISGKSTNECESILESLHNTRFVRQDLTLAIDSEREDLPSRTFWRFTHDRIRQAAYLLIDPEIVPWVRLRIARCMLDQFSSQRLSESLFEVVEHINNGLVLLTTFSEACEAIELNILAAQKARGASAYRSELQYLNCAKRLLESSKFSESFWATRKSLGIQLLRDLGESAFLDGQHAAAAAYVREAVDRVETEIEKAELLSVMIVHFTLLAKYPEAIEIGREALELLGVILPTERYSEVSASELALVRKSVSEKTFEDLTNLPVMTDEHWCAVTKIMIAMGPPCYRSHQKLWSVIVPKVVNLTLTYGQIPQIGYSHTALGGLLIWGDNDFDTARGFSDLASRLMTEKFSTPADQAVYHLMAGSSVCHWFSYLRNSSEEFEKAYTVGLNSGNLQFAAYAFGHNMYCRFFQGVYLNTLAQETRKSLTFSRSRRNQWAVDLLEAGARVVSRMTSSVVNGPSQALSEDDFCRQLEFNQNHQVVCIYRVMQSFCSLVMRDYETALKHSDLAEGAIHTVGTQGLLPWPEHVAIRFLIRTSLYQEVGQQTQELWRSELTTAIKQLATWAEQSPENFRHNHLLALAEFARIDGQILNAGKLLEEARISAMNNGFVHWAAIASEMAERLWIHADMPALEHNSRAQAYKTYSRWGASAKLQAMEQELRDSLTHKFCRLDFGHQKEGKDFHEIADRIIENQIALLHEEIENPKHASHELRVQKHAEELSQATERMRIEVVERKRAETALLIQNELLEERVSERTWELQKSRDELSILAERLELATRAKGMGIWDWNIVSNTLLCDNALCSLYGIRKEDFGGTFEAWLNYVHPSDLARVKLAIENSLQLGVPFNQEFRVCRADGKIRTIQAQRQVIRNAEGNPERMIGVSFDVTESKRQFILQSLRQEVSERVARGKALHEVLQFLAKSVDELETGAACAFEIDQMDCLDSCRIESERISNQRLKGSNAFLNRWELPILSSMRSVLGTLEIHNEQKNELEPEDRAFATSLSEIAAIAIEHTRYIETLERARVSAQVANQAKSEFLANMSHEIRTPMTAILGYTDILLDASNFESEPEQRVQSIQTIQRNGEHLLGIIDDILDLSKIESGMLEIESIAYSPVTIVDEVLSLMAVRATAKGIVLQSVFETHMPQAIQTDPTRLRQIILNLVSNAVKFTETGSVKVLVRFVQDGSSRLEFDVVDTGLGMSIEQQERLFRPFAQADSSTTRKFGGTGLGLTICKRLGEMMGGNVSIVSSSPGQGSCFRATIGALHANGISLVDPNLNQPANEIKQEESQWKTSALPLSELQILLAEDGPDNQRLISFLLRKAGASVTVVENGELAVNACLGAIEDNRPFHVVLMDMQMPVLDGYAATKRLRELGYQGCIIALTAHAMDGDELKCLNAGCDAYATKPIDRENLIRRILNHKVCVNSPAILVS